MVIKVAAGTWKFSQHADRIEAFSAFTIASLDIYGESVITRGEDLA
jgi:hypothetical protein